jgi:hypothetical protein
MILLVKGAVSNDEIRAFEAAFFLCLGLGKKKSLFCRDLIIQQSKRLLNTFSVLSNRFSF